MTGHKLSFDRILGAALLAAALVAAPGCGTAPEDETLETVAEEPERLADEIVTVEARVHRVLGDCAFELEDSGLLSPNRVLTLCDPAGPDRQPPLAGLNVAEGDWLRVTGVAAEMTREAYEYKTSLTVSDEVFNAREPRTVLFLHSAEKIESPEADEEARLPASLVGVQLQRG